MATTSGTQGDILIQIVHGSKKYKVNVTSLERTATVCDVTAAVEKATEVPAQAQRLIFKGKSLLDPEATLSDLGIKNGSKIMLLGKKPDLVSDENMVQLTSVEEKTERVQAQFREASEQLQSIRDGYLAENLHAEAHKKLSKQVKTCSEEFMRLLEKMDTLSLSASSQHVRAKRKTLTDKIQVLLDLCDAVLQELSGLTSGGR